MNRTGKRLITLAVVLSAGIVLSCSQGNNLSLEENTLPIEKEMLNGVWGSDGRTYDFVIEDDTILYEYEMVQHPYTIKNNVIIVDHGRELGTRRSRILELTEETLVLQDLETENTATFTRRQ